MLSSPEFWVAIAFVITIAGLVWLKVHRKIGDMLDARTAQIKAELDEAIKLREDAQSMLAQYQRKQREALQEADEIVEHAREEATRLAEAGARNLDAAIERREKMAADKITRAEADAVAEVRAAAVDVAMAATAKVLEARLNAQAQNDLIDGTINKLGSTLH